MVRRLSLSGAAGVLAAGAVVGALALAGCSADGGGADAEPDPTAAAAAFTPAADPRPFPEGASADTPDCQDASADTLAAVNATIVSSFPGQAESVQRLVAHPDPENAVWFLTGALTSTTGSEPFLVTWATTSEPTRPGFTGTIRAIGGTTASVSTALPLQLVAPDSEGGPPAAALLCAAGL
jgi:hypothetical protein